MNTDPAIVIFNEEQPRPKTPQDSSERRSHPRDAVLDGLKILLVEDEAHLREWMAFVLAPVGVEAKLAGDGEEALEVLGRGWIPDLIVSDVVMPGMSGIEFGLELKRSPQSRTIPLVFLSAHDDAEALRAGMRVGAADYVSKARLSVAGFLAALRKNAPKRGPRSPLVAPRPVPPPMGAPPFATSARARLRESLRPVVDSPEGGRSVIPMRHREPSQVAPVAEGPTVDLTAFSLLASAGLGIAVFDAHGNLVEMNAHAFKRLGFRGDGPKDLPDVVSQSLLEFGLKARGNGEFDQGQFAKWMPGTGVVVNLRHEFLESPSGVRSGHLVLIP